MQNFNVEQIKTLILTSGLNILIAFVVLFLGFKVSNFLVKRITKIMEARDVDKSLRPFLASVLGWTLKVCVVIAAINTAGIKTTSFIALLGTVGLAVGMALQGSLSNFAGGVLILLLKPFKVGDTIKAQGFIGTVDKITTFCTFLKTGDNQVICIPNGGLANSSIVNVNHEPTRRVDFVFGIGYGDDIDKAKAILDSIITSDSRVLKEPVHQIMVSELADSSVNITVRAWVNTPDYWKVFFETTEKVKKEFDLNKISIPFPQRDVHIHQS